MRHRIGATVIPLFLALVAPAASHAAGNLAEALAARGFEWPPYASSAIEYVRSLDDGGSEAPKLWKIAASSGGIKIRLRIQKGLNEAQAHRKTESEITRINMLYDGPAAYPGMITETNAIPSSLRPRKIVFKEDAGPAWLVPASSRLGYGVATPDAVSYESLFFFRYCPAKSTWARLDVFWPKRQFERAASLRTVAAFRCQSPAANASAHQP